MLGTLYTSGANFFSFSAGKRRVLLLGGREAIREGGSEGLREDVREGTMLLLPLNLVDFGGERLPGISNAHTHAHTYTNTHAQARLPLQLQQEEKEHYQQRHPQP